jgi:hypothetical protein
MTTHLPASPAIHWSQVRKIARALEQKKPIASLRRKYPEEEIREAVKMIEGKSK